VRLAPSAGLASFLIAQPVVAQPSDPHVVMQLDYRAAQGCPDEQLVRSAITAQVRRWDPFSPTGPWHLGALFMRTPQGYEAVAELRDPTGTVAWRRVLMARPTCADLVEDLAVVLALQIKEPEPTQPSPPPPPPFPLRQLPEASRPPEPLPIAPPPPATRRPVLRFGARAAMDVGTAPRPAFAITADVGVRVSWFSVAGEFHYTPTAGATAMNGLEVSTSLALGALVPCAHVGWFAGCLVGELGRFEGSIAQASITPEQRSMLYGAGGGRVGFEIPVLADRLFARVNATLLGAPYRPELQITMPSPQIAWQAPAVSASFGTGLAAAF
jgi:hypothetical protein